MEFAFPREGQQLGGEPRRAFCGGIDVAEHGLLRRCQIGLEGERICAALYGMEEVVEVMGDAASQNADGFKTL